MQRSLKVLTRRAAHAHGQHVSAVDTGYNKLTQSKKCTRIIRAGRTLPLEPISQRIAGQSIYVGRVQSHPTRRKLGLPGCLKSVGEHIEPLPTHELLTALNDPNPLMTRWPLMFATVATLLLTGRAHWWLNDDDGKLIFGRYHAIGCDHPTQCVSRGIYGPTIAPTNSDCQRRRRPASRCRILASRSVQLVRCNRKRLPCPPMKAFKLLNTEVSKTALCRALMLRVGKVPGMAGDDRRAASADAPNNELRSSIRQTIASRSNKRNEPLIVDGLLEGVERLSTTPAEMDFHAIGQPTKARILQAFGCNPIVVGEIQDSNRAAGYRCRTELLQQYVQSDLSNC